VGDIVGRDAVGDCVGDHDGDRVGEIDGEIDGEIVGATVGDNVGSTVYFEQSPGVLSRRASSSFCEVENPDKH
jgi:hypothetical protein